MPFLCGTSNLRSDGRCRVHARDRRFTAGPSDSGAWSRQGPILYLGLRHTWGMSLRDSSLPRHHDGNALKKDITASQPRSLTSLSFDGRFNL